MDDVKYVHCWRVCLQLLSSRKWSYQTNMVKNWWAYYMTLDPTRLLYCVMVFVPQRLSAFIFDFFPLQKQEKKWKLTWVCCIFSLSQGKRYYGESCQGIRKGRNLFLPLRLCWKWVSCFLFVFTDMYRIFYFFARHFFPICI
jgi:hypothetical protein